MMRKVGNIKNVLILFCLLFSIPTAVLCGNILMSCNISHIGDFSVLFCIFSDVMLEL